MFIPKRSFPAGTARASRPRRSKESSDEEARAGPGEASTERKSIFSLISKTHRFLLRENDEFLLLSQPNFYNLQTFEACGPRFPSTISKETACPSSNVRKPSPIMPVK